MMNVVSGFYWVLQYEKSPKATIARLTKNRGWEYMESEHSNKMVPNRPFKILQGPLEYKEQAEPKGFSFDVVSITDRDDGSADMVLDMDQETLKVFARVGILKVLTDAAEKTILEHTPKTQLLQEEQK
jgi:hypothetical protein